MFYIPYINGDTPADRNRRRTEELHRSLLELQRRLLGQAGAVGKMLDALAMPEEWGDEDALTLAHTSGRADWVARTLADDVQRRDRDNAEDVLRAAILASGYEPTTEED